jgi:hypothetical protein
MSDAQRSVQPAPRVGKGRRRLRPFAFGLVALLLVLAAGSWLNSRAFGDLLDAVEAGEAVLEDFNGEAAALVRSTPDEDAARANPQSAFWTAVSGLADEALIGLIVQQQRVRDVRIWPWDRDAARARARYLDHLEAWEEQLRGYGQREQAGEVAAIEATFTLLNDALAGAVPLLKSDYPGRVEAIAAD